MYNLGIDIGYSSLKTVLINEKYEMIEESYIFHRGKANEILHDKLKNLADKYSDRILTAGATGQGSKFLSFKQGVRVINEVTALTEGAKVLNKAVSSIIEIGGQSSKFITNINKGSAISISINSNCSAGTGSFLEEQASRLNINIEDYAKHAEKAAFIPSIAGRCSVFAKTDIIHHQQEGVASNEILLGLTYALVRNYRANVIKKSPIKAPVLLSGGVVKNKAVIRALKDVLKLTDEEIITTKSCGSILALGAAIMGMRAGSDFDINELLESVAGDEGENCTENTSHLLQLSGFGLDSSLNKHSRKKTYAKETVGYLGIDVGSTSTNIVLIDNENNVLDFTYFRTLGDPVYAVKRSLIEVEQNFPGGIKILGVGATGSGRYLAGEFAGVDIIVDEITAQAKAAARFDPDIDTVIEIGGQDSKFIRIEKGTVVDFEMNKICAAGTGSFLEDQAKKLNLSMDEFERQALSANNPIDLGDRCTVFIETNIASNLSKGAKIADISAGLCYSVARNYLNKVVGNKRIGSKVFFQGGVAHNSAVVNAFRALTGKKIIVPEYFSVTGALGAAILAKEGIGAVQTKFKGFRSERSKAETDIDPVKVPQKRKASKIFEKIEGYYLEGYEEIPAFDKKTVGIPRVLFLHKLFPLFNKFFKELGFNVLLSENSNARTVELSQEYSMEETCLPIKLVNGHVAQLIEKKVDFIFLPSLYTMAHPVSRTRQNYGCVYMQSLPKLIDKTMRLKERGIDLLSPELSFEAGKKYMMKTLLKLGHRLGRNKITTALALVKGMKHFKEFEEKLKKLGEEMLSGLDKEEKVLVIVTRAYGITDPILNMGIPEKLKDLGYKVLTLSNLPAHEHDTSAEHPNMYWPFGQHILSGAQIIRRHPKLYAVYITSHGCGPDTMLSHFFKEEMKGKPYLHIEVDEHFSSVGVQTRVEAFINSLKSETLGKGDEISLKSCSASVEHGKINIKTSLDKIDKSTQLFIPYLYPYSQLAASALAARGFKVDVLPKTSETTLAVGRGHVLSKEYFSFTALVGDVMAAAEEFSKEKKDFAFILPANEGSETDGQYSRLIRDKLDNSGCSRAEIIAPFIEDFIKDAKNINEIFLILLGGDIINLAPRGRRDHYLAKLQVQISKGELSIEALEAVAAEVHRETNGLRAQKCIFIGGDPFTLFNDFMNNNTFKRLENDGVRLKYAPLSEYMWFIWRDSLSRKKNLRDIAATRALEQMADNMGRIYRIFSFEGSFEDDIRKLVPIANEHSRLYSGANGRYRMTKALSKTSNFAGRIMVCSMYENTDTILSILSQDCIKDSGLPMLNLSFDGNENELDKSKIDSFMYVTRGRG